MYGVLPEELPADCSWVQPDDWGGGAEVTISQIERDHDSDGEGGHPVVLDAPGE